MNEQPDRQEWLTRELLEAVSEGQGLTQRGLAQRLGVALGLANAHLRYCVDNGWITRQRGTANRYVYSLTPEGISEKSRLRGQHLARLFAFYREASDSCIRCLDTARANGWHQVMLCGATELAEIAAFRAGEIGLNILGTLDPTYERDHFHDRPVWRRYEEVPTMDAWLLTHVDEALPTFLQLSAQLDETRALVPDILGFDGSVALYCAAESHVRPVYPDQAIGGAVGGSSRQSNKTEGE